MAYSLSFSEKFFLEGDPDAIQPASRPTSVYQAILSLKADQWERLAREVFHTEPGHLDPMTVLDEVRQTNTCSNLDSPVQVWIDAQGWHDVLVYDRAAN
jgi:hypothetical protein